MRIRMCHFMAMKKRSIKYCLYLFEFLIKIINELEYHNVILIIQLSQQKMRTNCSHGQTQSKFNILVSQPHHHHHCSHSSYKNPQQFGPTASTLYQQDVYNKIADSLQKQFKKTSIVKDNEINQLKNRISEMKIQMLELQDSKRETMEKQVKLQAQLSQLKLSKNSHISYQIREPRQIIRVQQRIVKEDDPLKDKQIRRLKQKNKQIQQQNVKLISELQKCKNENEQMSQLLRYERQRVSKLIQTAKTYEQDIQRLKHRLKKQCDSVLELQDKVRHLEAQSKNIKVQQRQKIVYKHDVKVQTIFVQKPVEKIVEKIVYRDVPKIIKQVVRPVVNRVIKCKNCNGEQNNNAFTEQQVQQLRLSYQQAIDSLHNNIKQYQQQRNRLVQVIRDRDSDLHLLEVQLRMLGLSTQPVSRNNGNHPSTVTVEVSKQNQESQSRAKRTQNPNINAQKGKKTTVSTRAMGSKRV